MTKPIHSLNLFSFKNIATAGQEWLASYFSAKEWLGLQVLPLKLSIVLKDVVNFPQTMLSLMMATVSLNIRRTIKGMKLLLSN